MWYSSCCFSFSDIRGKKRKCNASWINKYPFLRYSVTKAALYCVHCCLFPHRDGRDKTFSLGNPSSDWHHIGNLIEQHVKHTGHTECIRAGEQFLYTSQRSGSVRSQLLGQTAQDIQNNRHVLTEIIKVLILCGQQNIALRGHVEERGNFMAILSAKAENDPVLARHLASSKVKYTSPEVQNEILEIISNQIQHAVVTRCNESSCFSLIVDESTDRSKREQMSLNVRFVEKNNGLTEVHEEFLGFYRAKSTTGEAIFNLIIETTNDLGMDLTKLRGQTYDGASNMKGQHKGVQARMWQLQPKALYTHCRAHVLNLVVVHNCKEPIVRTLMDTVQKVSFSFNYSAKKLDRYQACLEEADPNIKECMGRRSKLQNLCETRWAARSDALFTFKASFPVVIEALSYLGEDDAECRAYGASISRFDFIIALVVCEHVLQILKQFSDYLQLPSLDLVQATVEAETIVKILRDERGEDNVYQALYDEAVELAAGVDVLPSKPRRAGRQMHRNNVEADSPFHYWKFALYNVFVDNIVEELEDQFIVTKPTFTAQLLIPTNLHKMAANDQLIIKHAYEPDINGDAFDMECRRWKARWSGEQNPPSTLTTTLDALDAELYPNISLILTVLLRFQWPLPLLKDLSAPWKE